LAEKKKKNLFGEAGSLIYTLLIVIFLQSFFIQSYGTPTGSMFNTILIGDRMFFNKFIYGASSPRTIPLTEIKLPYFTLPPIREPKQGDVVTFEFPGFREQAVPKEYVLYLKRIIGTPGDEVKIVNKKVFVNEVEMPVPKDAVFSRKPYPSNYINPEIFPKGSEWNEDNYGPIKVPKAGDKIALNSENFNLWETLIKREGDSVMIDSLSNKIYVNNKEASTYTVKENYYFMMGDNRDNSLDSRFWGFVRREAILGKAWLIYWSWNSEIPFSEFSKLIKSIRWDRIFSTIE
jgi:signal peptidase I